MSKKLLKEGTVRKFMKLANLSSFSNNFVNEKYNMDEELEEGGMAYNEVGMAREGLYEEEGDLEARDDDEKGDDMGGNADSVDPADVAQAAFAALADAFEGFGVEVSVDGADGDMEDDMEDMDDDDMDDDDMDDDDMDDEPPLMDGEPDGEVEGDEGPSELEESLFRLLDQSGIEIVDDRVMKEALVRKVAARVARRLLKESL